MNFCTFVIVINLVGLVVGDDEFPSTSVAPKTTTQRRFSCPLACFAYNYGDHYTLPTPDIWCRCPISVYGLSRQEIEQLPPVTGEPPLLESEIQSSSFMRNLVSYFYFFL